MSYYEMKNRAGVIGRTGLGPAQRSPRGGRPRPARPPDGAQLRRAAGRLLVVRPAARRGRREHPGALPAADPGRVLALLVREPGARLSCHRPWALAAFAGNVNGPLLATFSAADRALGWWYPAASMLAQQNAESVADLTYEWGAMGHDGYQQSPPGTTVKLAAPGTAYHFQPGAFYLLDVNAVISANQSTFSGAHSDIQHAPVIWPLLSAAH